MAYAAAASVNFTVENLLTKARPCFHPPCLKLLEQAQKEFKSFQKFLDGLGGGSRERMEDPLRRITEAMREFEDVLLAHLMDEVKTKRTDEMGLVLSMEVESLSQEFHVIFELMNGIKKERSGGDYAHHLGGNKPKMVGLSDVYNRLKRELLVDNREYKTNLFLIVGMAGIGKTALARAVFQDLDILEWFEFHVWVTIGRECDAGDIPRRILAKLDPDRARRLAEGDGDLETYLGEILKGKRYIIVLDDVWDIQVYSHLGFLPKNVIGTRFIVTSRSKHMAVHKDFISEVRLLTEKESWVLLREKLFGEKSCPPQLEKVGKQIAIKCDGLPLTIITVANLLSKIPESLWIDVATQRKHQVFIDAYDKISKVLYPSYEDLPQKFKLYFLYMAVFPPNFKIPRSRIINMWSVEELLELNVAIFSDDFVEECLDELSSNSLIMVHQKKRTSPSLRSIDGTKSCGLHSSWWHLCYTEARKNNFFYVLISREDRLEEDIKSQSRLSIHNNILFAIKDVYDSMEKNSASSACSLLCLGPYHRYPVPICFGLRFLVNLDAFNIRLYEFPLEVLELSELKYFSLTCDEEPPTSISKLHNLQFFIVERHHNIKFHRAPSYLPVDIWDMKELSYFKFMGSDLPDPPCGTILPNLKTLLYVSGYSCTKGIFEGIPHLKKLGIQIELALDVVEPLRCFDHISQLEELEILKCVVANPSECKFGVVSLPTSLYFPSGLKKLTLSGLGYPWEEMNKIASMSCLEVLKLRCTAFRGPKWEVEENEFPKLKFLVLEDTDLIQWKARRGSFKAIESISIKHCYKLKEVQWEFCVDQLDDIDIVDCNPYLENEIRGTMMRQLHIPDYFHIESFWETEDQHP